MKLRTWLAGAALIGSFAPGCADDAASGGAGGGGGTAAGTAAGGAAPTGGAAEGGTGGGGQPPLVCPEPSPPNGFFAASDGSPDGAGTEASPWDLATALQSAAIGPGSTLYLRGGTYAGAFVAKLDGSAGAPVVVRSYPGEWAVIDGAGSSDPTLQVYHAFTTFQDLELTSSSPDRNVARPSGIYVEGDHIRLINLVVHDVGTGVICNSGDGPDYAPELEVYGCLLYNNGWQETDRGHGHHLYLQNKDGTKHVRHNVMFNAFGFGVHAYSETDANWTQGYDIVENVWFGNGAALQGPDSKLYDGCLVGHNGTHPAARVLLQGNLGWNPLGERSVRLGYSATNEDVTLSDNYLVGSTVFASPWQSITINGNTLIGSVEGIDASLYPDNAYLDGAPPTETVSFVLPNLEQPGRGLVVVYNWSMAESVDVDLSSILPPGTPYEIRRAQDYLSGPVASGEYAGGTVTLSMMDEGIAQPIGLPDAIAPDELPGPRFDVFVVSGCL